MKKMKNVLVMKVEVQMGEDDRLYGAQVTIADADDPQKRSTRQFGTVGQAFDEILGDLLGMKMRQIAEHQQIHGQVGNA